MWSVGMASVAVAERRRWEVSEKGQRWDRAGSPRASLEGLGLFVMEMAGLEQHSHDVTPSSEDGCPESRRGGSVWRDGVPVRRGDYLGEGWWWSRQVAGTEVLRGGKSLGF